MDCSNKIPPSSTPAQHHKTHKTATPGQAPDTTKNIKTGETGPDHSIGKADIAAPAVVTCTEATPDHNKATGTATIEAAQGNPIQHTKATAAEPTMIHHTGHITDHSHTAAPQVTNLRTTIDQIHTNHKDHQNISHTSDNHTVKDLTPTRGPKDHTLIGIGRSI